jgi:hypothetical protein
MVRILQEDAKERGNQIDDEYREHYKRHLEEISQFLAACEIDISFYVSRITTKLHNPTGFKITLDTNLSELRTFISKELGERLFLFMPPTQAKYYERLDLFGPEVAAKFPEANKEISEAGNCYATGNNTACVFHLMRAVEFGARSLVRALKVKRGTGPDELPYPVELCDWGTIYGRLERAVRRLPARRSVKAAETRAFYSHAVAQFGNFKDAWRNKISHTRVSYRDRPHLVVDVMDNTRQFMQHLAERLKETR